MQPKNALFISAALTTFVLGTLAGVVNALNDPNLTATPSPVAVIESTATEALPTEEATEAAATQVGPEEAALIAAQFMDKQDLYSVETSTYEGVPAYLVTFSSGDMVYISPMGQVLVATKPTAVVVVAAPEPEKKKKRRDDAPNNNPPPAPATGGGGEDGGGEEDDD